MPTDHHHGAHRLHLAGLLVTLGIIYGDIGTSPLYVLKAIIGNRPISEQLVLGGVSCIFWTLTLQTTLKYVILTLRADNKGEGGIFSLYTLVKKTKVKWLLFPAIIGGSAVLSEGIITPAISVSSAVEGLLSLNPNLNTIPIIIGIIILLFFIQQFGTNLIGKSFGPIMFIWFAMLAVLGIASLNGSWFVLKAINPYYAYDLLVNYPKGFWLLGAVFLCTTGAEALYSDLGHCGRANIRVSWIFVKVALLLNYFGQAAWLLQHKGAFLEGKNPFYLLMPEWFLITGIIIATIATVVASQALISGSFTIVNEAMRLNLWPKLKIKYPTLLRGQIYIPSVNWFLLAGCIGIVLFFKESSAMEAAYGLTITIGMIMSTMLLFFYMRIKKYPTITIAAFLITYLTIEYSFLFANLEKLPHGGWISLVISLFLTTIMWVWYDAKKIRNSYVEFVKINDYLELLKDLSKDMSVSKYSTHLVYLTSAEKEDEIEAKVIYSILQKQPKRADIYWLVHINVVDEPYKMEYKVKHLAEDDVIRVDIIIGFRIAPRVNLMFRKVVQDLVQSKEVDITSRYESLNKKNVIGDFRFVVIEKFLSYDNDLPLYEKLILDVYFFLKHISLSEEKAFGLDTSSVAVEKFPLILSPATHINLKRIE